MSEIKIRIIYPQTMVNTPSNLPIVRSYIQQKDQNADKYFAGGNKMQLILYMNLQALRLKEARFEFCGNSFLQFSHIALSVLFPQYGHIIIFSSPIIWYYLSDRY